MNEYYDVIIVGTGAAGLYCALMLPERKKILMPHTEFVHPATRHNAMNVRMVEQIGTPRMKNGGHTGTQSLIACKGGDGGPCGLEHAIVEGSLMVNGYRMQAIRHREYHMEVLRGDNLLPAERNPLHHFLS